MGKKDESYEERCRLLDESRWAGELSWEEMQELALYLRTRAVPAGTTIFSEGDMAGYMCIIAEGEVSILKSDSRDANKHLASIPKGKPFGEMSLVDDWPRSASAVAAQDTILLVLSREYFNTLLEENPPLGVKILRKILWLVSHRLRHTSHMLVEYLSL